MTVPQENYSSIHSVLICLSELFATDISYLKELSIKTHKFIRSPRRFCCSYSRSLMKNQHSEFLGDRSANYKKFTLSHFACYHLITSKSLEGTVLQSYRNLISLATFDMEPCVKSLWKIHRAELIPQRFFLPHSLLCENNPSLNQQTIWPRKSAMNMSMSITGWLGRN